MLTVCVRLLLVLLLVLLLLVLLSVCGACVPAQPPLSAATRHIALLRGVVCGFGLATRRARQRKLISFVKKRLFLGRCVPSSYRC